MRWFMNVFLNSPSGERSWAFAKPNATSASITKSFFISNSVHQSISRYTPDKCNSTSAQRLEQRTFDFYGFPRRLKKTAFGMRSVTAAGIVLNREGALEASCTAYRSGDEVGSGEDQAA